MSASYLQVAGGHTDLGVVAMGSGKSMIDAGKVRLLAVLGEKRATAPYDNVPTMKELGYDVSWESTNYFMGPPNLPKHAEDVLVKAIYTGMHDPGFQKFCAERSARWEYVPPDKIVENFDKQRIVVQEIMKKAGILPKK